MGLSNSKTYLDDTWLKNWTLVEFLGSGSYGGVYKTKNKTTTEESAVKITYFSDALDTQITEKNRVRIRKEFLLLHGKRHKNIVNVHEELEAVLNLNELQWLLKNVASSRFARHAQCNFEFLASSETGLNALFIRMELCGMNHRHWIDKCEYPDQIPFIPIAQKNIINDILEGLEFLHQNKILHRDLKSENIFFAGSGSQYGKHHVKIGDFGISRIIHSEDSKTSEQTVEPMTSPLYKAPELDTGEEYALQADLYSLGLIIYEIIKMLKSNCRRLAFSKLKNRAFELNLPKEPFVNASSVIKQLTENQPKNRLETIEDVRLQLSPLIILENREYSSSEFQGIVTYFNSILGNPSGGSVVAGQFNLDWDNRVIQAVVFRCDLRITGNKNKLSNVTFYSETDGIHIFIKGSENIINNIRTDCSILSVRLFGDRNTIANAALGTSISASIHIRVWSGNGHVIGNVIPHCNILFYDGTSNCSVENVKPGSDSFLYGNSHTLRNVECNSLKTEGTYHKFIRCRGSIETSFDFSYEFVDCVLEVVH